MSYDDLYRSFRAMFKAVTPEAIEAYERDYRGSDEEVADLVAYYKRFSGRMDHVTEYVLFATDEDRWRFKQVLDAQLAEGTIPKKKAYKHFNPPRGPSREEAMHRAQRKHKRSRKRGTGADLVAMIQGNAQRREAALLDSLEAKYAPRKKAKK